MCEKCAYLVCAGQRAAHAHRPRKPSPRSCESTWRSPPAAACALCGCRFLAFLFRCVVCVWAAGAGGGASTLNLRRKLRQPLWKTVRSFLGNSKSELPKDSWTQTAVWGSWGQGVGGGGRGHKGDKWSWKSTIK